MISENVTPVFEFMDRRFWIVHDIDPNIFYWETFTAEDIMGLPYSDIPDMTDVKIETKKDLCEFLLNNNIYFSDGEISGVYHFRKNVKKNDVVALQQNKQITLIGIVNSNYTYVEDDIFPHRIYVGWGFCNVGMDDIVITLPKIDISITELKDQNKKYEIFAALSELHKCVMS